MKTKACRFFLLLFLCQTLWLFLVGCTASRQEETVTDLDTQMTLEGNTAYSFDRQFEILQWMDPAEIQKVDFMRVRPENGGTRVYKTFTETSDIQAVLDILKDVDLQPAENQEPQGGWTVALRIWTSTQSGESAEPLLISTGGDTSVRIGNYAYTAKSAAYYTDLLALFEASAAEEKPYIM